MHSATSDRSSLLTRLHRVAIPGGINVEQEPLGYGHSKASCRCNVRLGLALDVPWVIRFMVEISQPAQEGRDPETVAAWRVAPQMGNG